MRPMGIPRRRRWDSELRTLFKKIDAGCSETVTWEDIRLHVDKLILTLCSRKLLRC